MFFWPPPFPLIFLSLAWISELYARWLATIHPVIYSPIKEFCLSPHQREKESWYRSQSHVITRCEGESTRILVASWTLYLYWPGYSMLCKAMASPEPEARLSPTLWHLLNIDWELGDSPWRGSARFLSKNSEFIQRVVALFIRSLFSLIFLFLFLFLFIAFYFFSITWLFRFSNIIFTFFVLKKTYRHVSSLIFDEKSVEIWFWIFDLMVDLILHSDMDKDHIIHWLLHQQIFLLSNRASIRMKMCRIPFLPLVIFQMKNSGLFFLNRRIGWSRVYSDHR